ncbi:uncharacterized protein N7483_008029 [Penicillium malachiteum]|uniref:uncharacterized protein n=1 Tax=Penicillium malachiteum TaxID=1324776 RepID=UPI0025465A80|nr:uncharacterized protein N7483_008029 [Penicillium malachiteum]KAJ5726672.1 hypothetical protein N7483_008029 [Penicillium malachiteum]
MLPKERKWQPDTELNAEQFPRDDPESSLGHMHPTSEIHHKQTTLNALEEDTCMDMEEPMEGFTYVGANQIEDEKEKSEMVMNASPVT